MIMIVILAEERNVSRVIAVIVLEIVKVTLLFKCAVYVYVRFMGKLDGFDAYEFHGCLWCRCPRCHAISSVHPTVLREECRRPSVKIRPR